MKNIFVLFLLLIPLCGLFAQKKEDIFKKYTAEKYYEVNNREIVVSKIIENLSVGKNDKNAPLENKVK